MNQRKNSVGKCQICRSNFLIDGQVNSLTDVHCSSCRRKQSLSIAPDPDRAKTERAKIVRARTQASRPIHLESLPTLEVQGNLNHRQNPQIDEKSAHVNVTEINNGPVEAKKPELEAVITVIATAIVVAPVLLCCIWLILAVGPGEPTYYNYSPVAVSNGDDLKYNLSENRRIPLIFKSKMCGDAKLFIENVSGMDVATSFLDSSRPVAPGSRWEEFTVVAVLDDGNRWLERRAFHVTYQVDVSLPHFTYQAKTIRRSGYNEVKVRY